MVKQHHIVYEKPVNKYWFILPDDSEREVFINQIEDTDFNIIYIEMYKLYLSNRKKYDRLKELKIDQMIAELLV